MYDPDEDYDLLADRLAGKLTDDEEQLDQLGAEWLTTAKLIEMKGRYQERLDQFDDWQGLFLKMALFSPTCLVLGTGLFWVGLARAAWFLLAAFPVFFLVALVGIGFLWHKTKGRREIEHRLEEVTAALNKRLIAAGDSRKAG